MSKKIFILFAALLMAASFSACSSNKNDNDKPAETESISESTQAPASGQSFDPAEISQGDKLGYFTVSQVEKADIYTAVSFSCDIVLYGDVKIENGMYNFYYTDEYAAFLPQPEGAVKTGKIQLDFDAAKEIITSDCTCALNFTDYSVKISGGVVAEASVSFTKASTEIISVS